MLLDDESVAVLKRWIEAGHDLGNHSFSHSDLHRIPLEEFKKDVLRGGQITRKLMRAAGKKPNYFRFPYLHTGQDLETKKDFKVFLNKHGYRVAPVTLDNAEWIFARAYDEAAARKDTL